MRTGRISLILAIALGAVVCVPNACVAKAQQTTQSNDDSQQQNPLTRQLSDKQRFKQQSVLTMLRPACVSF